MLKITISSLALAAALGVAAPPVHAGSGEMTNITPVAAIPAQPTLLAQAQVNSPPSAPASAFDAGLADRRAYEEWFASLDGDIKKGAEYWAGQRSLEKPGSCYAPDGSSTGEWTQGCLAAQRQLAASDVRRKAEPEYRQGWNSFTPAASPVTAPPTAPTPASTAATPATAPVAAPPTEQTNKASPAPVAPSVAPAMAQENSPTPQAGFNTYPVPEFYRGPPMMPDFGGRDRQFKDFRTRIRNGITEGANFAGRYKVIQFGCGTGCSVVLVADVSTGRVFSFPHGGEYDQSLQLVSLSS